MESFQFQSKSELRMEGRMREKRGGGGGEQIENEEKTRVEQS